MLEDSKIICHMPWPVSEEIYAELLGETFDAVRSFEGRRGESDARRRVDFQIASLWSHIMTKSREQELRAREKELWKMGLPIDARNSVFPVMRVWFEDDGLHWSLNGRGFWFPSTSGGYADLWDKICCGRRSYGELVEQAMERSIEDEFQNIGRLYDGVIASNIGKLPRMSRLPFRKWAASRWLGKVSSMTDVDIMLDSCLAGVPAEYILA